MARKPPSVAFAFFGFLCLAASNQQDADRPLPSIQGARSIRIEEHWMGLSPASPRSSVYFFSRDGERVRGWAMFRVRSHGENIADIQLPIEVFDKFLRTLGDSRFVPRPYKPKITHTDDYPSIRVEIAGEHNIIVFFTGSQGERHVPWGVDIDGAEYLLRSDSPQKAIDILSPYLHREVLQRLEQEVGAAGPIR